MQEANFQGANLSHTNLSGAFLVDANFKDANLSYADLSDAYISKVNFSGANLTHASLEDAKADEAKFEQADLQDARLTGTSLRAANFTCARLRCTPRMATCSRGESPLRAVVCGTASQRQGRHREVGSEGSPRQNPDLTNRNRIQGRQGGVRRQRTPTPNTHRDTPGGTSGRDRATASRLIVGDLTSRRDDPGS